MIFPLRKFYATELPRFHQASAQTRAQRVAECAYAAAAQLRHDYGVIGPPLFNNFLVNLGIRKRGLCFQWAEDLLVQLDALKLRTLQVHWAEARAGSLREHNCVVGHGQRPAVSRRNHSRLLAPLRPFILVPACH